MKAKPRKHEYWLRTAVSLATGGYFRLLLSEFKGGYNFYVCPSHECE